MSKKEKSTPPGIMLVMCAWIGVMLSFLVLIGFANAPKLCVKSVKEEIIYKQIKNIKAFEENLDKVLDDAEKEKKIILARLGNACESRNKPVHKIVNISFKNEKPDTKAKVIPFKSLGTILTTDH